MYHIHKKSAANAGEKITPTGCFVERTRNWFWTIIIFVFGAIVYSIVTSSGQGPVYSAVEQSIPQGGQLQNVALTRCPYCPGFLDAKGRCNVRECPIYSPNWEKTSTSPRSISVRGIPVKRVLIKELALEVGASQGKTSVVIQAVYAGGNAEKAGLKVGDRIVRFNGRNIKNVKQFKSIVTRAKPEVTVKIQVIRNGKKIKSSVMIGEGEMEGVTVPKK
ncbi:MAG: PDZ domain-containing protein [Planctomycetota bacterium]|jgi:membrane-associated protease RseP (regulator of RpoE activity)